MRIPALLVLAAALPAHADDASAPPRETPFDRGKFALSAGGGTSSSFGHSYIVLGGGVGYYVLDGVEVMLSGEYQFGGDGPSIAELSPQLRYVAQPLVGAWPVVPYVGVFYNHWFVGDGNPDVDSIGGRVGGLWVSGNIVLGLGLGYEHVLSPCTDCEIIYPDVTIALAL
jgi:hypothetical protein